MNILLTSAGRRTYLVEYFKEALQMAGVEGHVHAANSQECPAFYAADQWVKTPLIYESEYIPFLLDYCKHKRIGMVIPLFDIDVPVLAAHRAEFEAIGTILVTADETIARICNDKWRMDCRRIFPFSIWLIIFPCRRRNLATSTKRRLAIQSWSM